jgi:predicted transcriptional regulator
VTPNHPDCPPLLIESSIAIKLTQKVGMNFMEDTNQNIGFIMGNNQRQRVLQVLGSKGALSSEKVAKIEHIPVPRVEKTLEELAARNIVAKKEGIWSLTEMGAEIEKEMKKRA